MTKIITIDHLQQLIEKHGLTSFFQDLLLYLKEDFSRWDKFHKIPRVAAEVPKGIIELMPIWDDRYYSYKYVNGHPTNTSSNLLTVVAFGALSSIENGYPLLLSEMTLLTGIRTAAASALASQYLIQPHTKTMAIIGTGAQSEFQALAHQIGCSIETIRYFDLDPEAMQRFHSNLQKTSLKLIPCKSVEEAIDGAYLITTATARAGHREVIKNSWIQPGVHLNGIGGDSPGKTEFSKATLERAKIVIEFFPQTEHEGEIQQFPSEERKKHVYAELWELVSGKKKGRTSKEEITLYDSVGFALEDYSVLRLVYDLAKKYHIGLELPIIPTLKDPKDLMSLLKVDRL